MQYVQIYFKKFPSPLYLFTGLKCHTKVSKRSILNHCETCQGCKKASSLMIEHEIKITIRSPTPIKNFQTEFFNDEEFSVVFFLVGIEVGERTIFLVKYTGGENRYRMELKLPGEERSIYFQGEAIHLSTDPDSALREGNAMEVFKSVLEKISRNTTDGGFSLEIEIKISKVWKYCVPILTNTPVLFSQNFSFSYFFCFLSKIFYFPKTGEFL